MNKQNEDEMIRENEMTDVMKQMTEKQLNGEDENDPIEFTELPKDHYCILQKEKC